MKRLPQVILLASAFGLLYSLFSIELRPARAEEASATIIESENGLYSQEACFGGKETPDIRRPPPPFPRLVFQNGMPTISLDIKSIIEIMAVFSPPETKERVSVFAVPGAPRSGDSLRLLASQENYISDFTRMYYGWCINNVSAQGWVAGGRDVLAKDQNMTNPGTPLYSQNESTFPNVILDDIEPQDVPFVNDRTEFTSNPGVNPSNVTIPPPDPNDPRWNDDNNLNACCHTVYRDLPLGRDENHDGVDDQWQRRYFGSLPDDPSVTTPDEQDPAYIFADPDHDGYRAADFKGDTDFLVPTPSVQTNPVYQPEGDWTPRGNICTRKSYSFTGDGCFTNYEEWTWGTNPLDADTDDDGYPDEADIVGLGQNRLEYRPIAFPGDVTMARVTGIGMVMAKDPRTGKNPIRIATNALAVQWRSANELSVVLSSPVELAIAGGTVEVQANIQGTKTPPGTLSYEWSVNGRSLPAPGGDTAQDLYAISGYGDILRYQIPEAASGGDRYQFQVRVVDEGEAQAAKADKVLSVAEMITPVADPAAFDPIDFNACREAETQEEKDAACERIVQITAGMPELGSENKNNFAFAWFIDGAISPTGCGDDGLSTCGLGSDKLLLRIRDNAEHEVRVRLIHRTPLGSTSSASPFTSPDRDQVIARGMVKIGPEIVDPATSVSTVTPERPNGSLTEAQRFRVTLDARGTDEAITYHWLVNGEEVAVTYNDPMWTYNPISPGIHEVSVRIERQGGSTSIASTQYFVQEPAPSLNVWTATLSSWFGPAGKIILSLFGAGVAIFLAVLGLKRLPT